MKNRYLNKTLSFLLSGFMIFGYLATIIFSAQADSHILPENQSDIGIYTDGKNHVSAIGHPTYNYVNEISEKLKPGVEFTANSMYKSIYEKDLAAGGTDYYLDRVLGVRGNIGGSVLQTRGRSLYMRGNSTLGTMGFAGSAYAGGVTSLGSFYTVTVDGQSVSEVNTNRFNAPSHFSSVYNIGSTGISANMKKFITYDNVAGTVITLNNTSDSAKTIKLLATSSIAKTAVDGSADELTGQVTLMSGSNNGLVNTPWSKVTIGLKATGFSANNGRLERSVTVGAGETLDVSVMGVLYSNDLPESESSFYDYAEYTPSTAFKTAVTDFNSRWAQDIPYINLPDPAIEKAIIYRWWGERYNSLDTNSSGHVYQFPVTIEGVNLYQNAVVLTQPMHLQDTKWIRNPYLAYGQIMNVGELSGSSAFLDSPGHTSWNNHYSQYIGSIGLEAYNVHGGGTEIAKTFAYYFENDGKGQLDHYDGDKDMLIGYDTNYMPGNDADAISFGYPKSNTSSTNGSRNISRPESAYVWGDFDSASKLYALAGESEEKITEMNDYATGIKNAILENLWSDEMRMFLAGTTRGAVAANSSNNGTNPLTDKTLIPAKESNLYDIYAQNLIPAEDHEKYVDGFRFLTYGDNHPIFPFYTANQYDRSKFGIGGSNNFSNINFTVQYRGVRSGLRYYDPDQKYLTPAYAAQLLEWMAWSIYPNADLRVPNQAEYYSNWNSSTKSYSRNNPNHVMLGNMNYIFIEDMGGILPRSDEKIELFPIDFGYDYFMVNNLRYHGSDLTIVWDKDGSKYNLGTGYMLFIDGEKVLTSDKLGHITYDPASGEYEAAEGMIIDVTDESVPFSDAVSTEIEDSRVVEYLKKAGIDLEETSENLAKKATVTADYTQTGNRPSAWRNFHTPGRSGAMNYDPGAISTNEKPVSISAITDGVTVNEPYWGNYGTTAKDGWVEFEFDEEVSFDNIKLFFVSDRQDNGYSEPLSYFIQVPSGDTWLSIEGQFKSPKIPSPKFNETLFPTVTTNKVRVYFNNKPEHYTAISEIQIFNSGREVPEVVNEAPNVTVSVDTTKNGNISTVLVATVTDDGLPENKELTFGWTVVSKPEDSSVIFMNQNLTTTKVVGTKAGEYEFAFWAFDGGLRTEKSIKVTLTEKEISAEFGSLASINTSGTSSWENHNMVNNSSTPTGSNTNTGQGWGCWGQTQNGTSQSKKAWIEYSWDSPIMISSTEIYWYDDTGGTRTPTETGYNIQYSDDRVNWIDISLKEGSTYANAVKLNTYNKLEFDAVNAKYIRINIWALKGSGAGTGVLRWRVNGENVDSVNEPVIMRVVKGNLPNLPSKLGIVYSNGQNAKLDFVWEEVTQDMVAETNVEPFVIYGTNATYGLLAEAHIYVRPEDSVGGITVSSFTDVYQTVEVGEAPTFPESVLVSYNDGSRDNQVHTVEWEYNPSMILTPGVHEIKGNVYLPSYVAATEAYPIFYLTVESDAPLVDKTALNEAINNAKTLVETDYTASTWAIFAQALNDAESVYALETATQDQVDNAITALSLATEGLVRYIPITSIKINSSAITTIGLGSSTTITATISPRDATYQEVVWTSSNSSILSVDSKGEITALKTGMVTLTVKTLDGNFSHTIMVRVTV